MMPQKLNPDVAELARGKAGTAIGRLTGPARDGEGAAARVQPRPPGGQAAGVRRAARRPRGARRAGGARRRTCGSTASGWRRPRPIPLLLATDAAEALVAEGVPFRDAHEQVARAVREGAFDPDSTAAESVAARLGDVAAAVAEAPRSASCSARRDGRVRTRRLPRPRSARSGRTRARCRPPRPRSRGRGAARGRRASRSRRPRAPGRPPRARPRAAGGRGPASEPSRRVLVTRSRWTPASGALAARVRRGATSVSRHPAVGDHSPVLRVDGDDQPLAEALGQQGQAEAGPSEGGRADDRSGPRLRRAPPASPRCLAARRRPAPARRRPRPSRRARASGGPRTRRRGRRGAATRAPSAANRAPPPRGSPPSIVTRSRRPPRAGRSGPRGRRARG